MNNKIKDLTENFSVEKLPIVKGEISKSQQEDFYTIMLPIAKFILDDKIVETELFFTRILLPKTLLSYIGQTVLYPINPNIGYVDGSIYLRDAHSPIDISEIKFIEIENNTLKVEINMEFVFEFEGIGFKNERLFKEVLLTII